MALFNSMLDLVIRTRGFEDENTIFFAYLISITPYNAINERRVKAVFKGIMEEEETTISWL